MKKVLAFIILLSLIMSVGISAFAGGNKNKNMNEKSKIVISKAKNRIEYVKELKTLSDQLKNNNKETRQLRNQFKSSVGKLKNILLKLKENPGDLTQEQIDEIANVLASLKQQRLQFGTNHMDKLNKNIVPGLRSAKQGRDLDAVKKSFEKIFEEQKSRNDDLKILIEKINALILKYSSIKISVSESSSSESTSSKSISASSLISQEA